MNGNLIKVMAIFVFFGFAECAAGSCLNYGHACWGAHGKRSQQSDRDEPGKFPDPGWFLSRLVQNADDLSRSDGDGNGAGTFPREQERRIEDWNQLADEQIFDGQYERIRLPKHLDKRSPSRN